MNKPKSDDKLQTRIESPRASRRDHADAYAYLRRRHAGGTLLPVRDGTGDPVADYAAILGLKP